MRLASVETVLPSGIPTELPARSVQTTSQTAALFKLAIMLPAATALLIPYLLMAERLASSEAFRQALNDRPVAALQLAIGLAFWTLLFGWPLKHLAESFARMRSVKISRGVVDVTDTSLLDLHAWSAPINEFLGLAHNIRSSLSGVRHELVLVHPDRSMNVLLAIAPNFSQTQIKDLCALLDCPEVSSRELYNFRFSTKSWPRFGRTVAGSAPQA